MSQTRWTLLSALAVMVCLTAAAPRLHADDAAPRPARLFILSGQSNMGGLDPDASFTPAVTQAFPDDKIIVVKYAKTGQLIGRWYKDWQPPSTGPAGNDKPGGTGGLYDLLMEAVTAAMEGIDRPVSVTFVWMQGESDGKREGYGSVYREALEGLLKQLQTDLGREDIDFVIGRISDFGNNRAGFPDWIAVREAQVAFADADPARRAWIDTDDLNGAGDALHYGPDRSKTLGERFADKAIALIRARDQAAKP